MEAVNINAKIPMGAICASVMEGSSWIATERHAQVNLILCLRNVNCYNELEIKYPWFHRTICFYSISSGLKKYH